MAGRATMDQSLANRSAMNRSRTALGGLYSDKGTEIWLIESHASLAENATISGINSTIRESRARADGDSRNTFPNEQRIIFRLSRCLLK
jgi:hypothetical protein